MAAAIISIISHLQHRCGHVCGIYVNTCIFIYGHAAWGVLEGNFLSLAVITIMISAGFWLRLLLFLLKILRETG